MITLEPPYQEIADLLLEGKIIPFLGAAASRTGVADQAWDDVAPQWLPTAGELGHYLAGRVNFPAQDVYDLATVAQYFQVVMHRPILRQRLHSVFDHDFKWGPLHDLLATLPVPLLIVTTNYDDLIERAFEAHNLRFDRVIYPADNEDYKAAVLHWRHGDTEPTTVAPKKLDLDLSTTTVIYKIHGGVDRQFKGRNDSFVITEDDYVDFLNRIARGTAIPPCFSEQFDQNSFLFLGYGLRDWNFRVILSRIKHKYDDQGAPSWAIQFKPSQLERELWDKRGVRIYDVAIDEFVHSLRAKGGLGSLK